MLALIFISLLTWVITGTKPTIAPMSVKKAHSCLNDVYSYMTVILRVLTTSITKLVTYFKQQLIQLQTIINMAMQ